MSPESKFNAIVISLTTAFVYALWIMLSEIIIEYEWKSVVLSAVISLGVFKFFHWVVDMLFSKINFLKMFILGPSYLEGTWIGFYIKDDGNIRFYVENFEQELNSLVIRGKSFEQDGKFRTSWTSNTTYIDVKKGRLTYYYETDPIEEPTLNPGLAIFQFIRKSSDTFPTSLIGFSSNLSSQQKIRSYEERIEGPFTLTNEAILRKAREIYENNKFIAHGE